MAACSRPGSQSSAHPMLLQQMRPDVRSTIWTASAMRWRPTKAWRDRLPLVLARHDPGSGERPPLVLIDTDFELARQVGTILHASGRGSAHIVDAHVVASCVTRGGGLVITSDAEDILALADAVPAVRIRVFPL